MASTPNAVPAAVLEGRAYGMPSGRIVVAVGAIVEDGDRFLLVKHVRERRSFWSGKWIFPGGKLDTGESIADGIRREVLEETGLDIEVGRANPLAERIVRDGAHVPLHVLYITHMARRVGGTLRTASDVGEALWVSRDGLGSAWADMHEDTQRIAFLAGIMARR